MNATSIVAGMQEIKVFLFLELPGIKIYIYIYIFFFLQLVESADAEPAVVESHCM